MNLDTSISFFGQPINFNANETQIFRQVNSSFQPGAQNYRSIEFEDIRLDDEPPAQLQRLQRAEAHQMSQQVLMKLALDVYDPRRKALKDVAAQRARSASDPGHGLGSAREASEEEVRRSNQTQHDMSCDLVGRPAFLDTPKQRLFALNSGIRSPKPPDLVNLDHHSKVQILELDRSPDSTDKQQPHLKLETEE